MILEKHVAQFRNEWGLGHADSLRLESLLTRLNVLTVFKPLRETISGMAIKVQTGDRLHKFMLVNSNNTIGHQHFTICHELYHLFIQGDFHNRLCQTGLFDRKDAEEYNADVFAAFLLMPEQGIKSMIPDEELTMDRLSLTTVLNLEQYFSCSRKALLYRLKNLRIISAEALKKFSVNVKKSAMAHGKPLRLYEPGNHNLVIGDYGDMAVELFDKMLISESHYHTIMDDLGMYETGESESYDYEQ